MTRQVRRERREAERKAKKAEYKRLQTEAVNPNAHTMAANPHGVPATPNPTRVLPFSRELEDEFSPEFLAEVQAVRERVHAKARGLNPNPVTNAVPDSVSKSAPSSEKLASFGNSRTHARSGDRIVIPGEAQTTRMRAPSQGKEPDALYAARLTPRPSCACSSIDPAAFEALLQDLLAEHQPATITEKLLVEQMAQSAWLKQRAIRMQEDCFEDGIVAEHRERAFALYIRYQTTHERSFHRALNDLLKLRAQRRKEEIGFERKKRQEAEHARRQAAENRKADMHKFNLMLAQAKIDHEEIKMGNLELDRFIAQHRQGQLAPAAQARS